MNYNRLNIAFVDDFSPYSHNLINNGLLNEKINILFYGPKLKLHKFYPKTNFERVKKKNVWTPLLFPLQIFRQVVFDKPDLVHIQFEVNTFGPLFTNLFFPYLLLLLRLRGTKVVVTMHSVINSIYFLKGWNILKVPLTAFYLLTSRLTNIFIVHNEIFKEQLEQLYKLKDHKIYVIPHGVSPNKSTCINLNNSELALRLRNNKFVLFFGTLSPRKGVEYLLQAFKKVSLCCSNCILVIAGDSLKQYEDHKKRLESLTFELDFQENVIFTGFIENETVDYLFSKASLFVLPYTFSASASGPLSMAMQNGLPIIATKTHYFQSILKNNYDSLLVSPSDSESLAEAILKLLEDQALSQKLSANISKKAKEYSWQRIAKMTTELYGNTCVLRSVP